MSALTAPEIILRPVISEKSIDESGRGKYTFAVHDKANKNVVTVFAVYMMAGPMNSRTAPMSFVKCARSEPVDRS